LAGVSFGVLRPTTERGEMSEGRRERLEAGLEAAERTLRDALDFLSDDRNLTDKGIAARVLLLGAIEAIERDLEAVRQEHRPA
jgi:hypothetical protein